MQLTVSELISMLSNLPDEMPVMLAFEGGVDFAQAVRVAEVARHKRDWTGTPIGQYREMPNEGDEVDAQVFKVAIVE